MGLNRACSLFACAAASQKDIELEESRLVDEEEEEEERVVFLLPLFSFPFSST